MKWRNYWGKKWDESKKYNFGERRTIKIFAFTPLQIGFDTVWLEYYNQHQVWEGWNTGWKDLEKEVIE